MASVCGTRGKRAASCFAALKMSVADFWADSKPRRRMIGSGRLFDVERQSWLAELRQNCAPISCSLAIQQGHSLRNKSKNRIGFQVPQNVIHGV